MLQFQESLNSFLPVTMIHIVFHYLVLSKRQIYRRMRKKAILRKRVEPEVISTVHCNIFSGSSRIDACEMNYMSMTNTSNGTPTARILLDSDEETRNYPDCTKICSPKYFYCFSNYVLFKHPTRFTWFKLSKWNTKNRCGTCDGTTKSSIHVREEQSLLDLFRFHFIQKELEALNVWKNYYSYYL